MEVERGGAKRKRKRARDRVGREREEERDRIVQKSIMVRESKCERKVKFKRTKVIDIKF